jgi:hypothetical protein
LSRSVSCLPADYRSFATIAAFYTAQVPAAASSAGRGKNWKPAGISATASPNKGKKKEADREGHLARIWIRTSRRRRWPAMCFCRQRRICRVRERPFELLRLRRGRPLLRAQLFQLRDRRRAHAPRKASGRDPQLPCRQTERSCGCQPCHIGKTGRIANVGSWQILLQKSFALVIKISFGGTRDFLIARARLWMCCVLNAS